MDVLSTRIPNQLDCVDFARPRRSEVTRSAIAARCAAEELRPAMKGNVILACDDAFEQTRKVWNGAVSQRPALFACCATLADVQLAVRSAQANGLELSVRGGGHDWAGRALRHDGLVIDLRPMRQIEIDPDECIAIVGGGVVTKELIAAAAPHGLVAVTGTSSGAGVAGDCLGGGYGPLIGCHGLAQDNLLAAEIVLANGRKVNASADENEDLFWALRGGGANFGVVTSMKIRLHALENIASGMVLYPWAEARSVLRRYAEFSRSTDDDLSVVSVISRGPDGEPVVLFAPAWCGEPDEGAKVLDALKRLGNPIHASVGPMTYQTMLGLLDMHAISGRHYASQTRWLEALTPGAIDALIDGIDKRTSPYSMITMHHFHGQATRVGSSETAFALRREHFMVEMLAAWEPDEQDDAAWAQSLATSLTPFALPGGYANLLGPDEHARTASGYGINAARLKAVKRRYDPDGVFTANGALA
jgi:FAD/FMN-containing dehydrogenase